MRILIRIVIEFVAPALIACWIAVFAVAALSSATGFTALRTLEAEAAALAAEVDDLAAHRAALERRAHMLNSASLDADLVEERARAVLGYVRPGDIVMPRDELERLLRESDGDR